MTRTTGPRDAHADLGGWRLHYLEWGRPEAPPVVFLHALGALVTAHHWDAIAAAMQDRYRVIVPDQRGFGLSDWQQAYSFQLMAHDLAELVERLELDGLILVGHSMGGTVACLYAETRPAALQRLILEDTVPPRAAQRIGPRPALRWEFADVSELVAVARANGRTDPEDELRRLIDHAVRRLPDGRVAFRLDPAVPTAILGQLADPDPAWWRDLPSIAVPTLILRGATSQVVDVNLAGAAATAILACQVVEVPGAGHDIHADQPTAFVEAIRAFLE